jgi:hypothetical protein
LGGGGGWKGGWIGSQTGMDAATMRNAEERSRSARQNPKITDRAALFEASEIPVDWTKLGALTENVARLIREDNVVSVVTRGADS